MILTPNPESYARWIEFLIAVGIAVDSLEILRSRNEYGSQGILSWRILALDSRFVLTGPGSRIFRTVLGSPGYLILISLQFILALAIIARINDIILATCIATLLVIKLLSNLRNVHGGLDGSDQMQLVILASLTVYSWAGDESTRVFALWFIAGQSILSYIAAGVAKLVSPVWRKGVALTGVMATDDYGSRMIGRWLSANPRIARASCWGIIIFECAAPLLIFVGRTPCIIFLACALTFHIAIAAIMGLNNFLWSFGAAFPAILFLSASV